MGETRKTKARWIASGLYEQYIAGRTGADIGVGRFDTSDGADTINPDFYQFDKDDGDATLLEIFADNSLDVLWLSHLIEHLDDPMTCIANCLRVVKPGGHVCIFLPHKELYEDKDMLPSRWNADHRTMWLPDAYEPPNTFSVKHTVEDAIKRSGIKAKILWVKTCDENWVKPNIETHASGEYQIECVIEKL